MLPALLEPPLLSCEAGLMQGCCQVQNTMHRRGVHCSQHTGSTEMALATIPSLTTDPKGQC